MITVEPTVGCWCGGEVITCHKNASQTAEQASYCCNYSRVLGEQCNSSISASIHCPIDKGELSVLCEGWVEILLGIKTSVHGVMD